MESGRAECAKGRTTASGDSRWTTILRTTLAGDWRPCHETATEWSTCPVVFRRPLRLPLRLPLRGAAAGGESHSTKGNDWLALRRIALHCTTTCVEKNKRNNVNEATTGQANTHVSRPRKSPRRRPQPQQSMRKFSCVFSRVWGRFGTRAVVCFDSAGAQTGPKSGPGSDPGQGKFANRTSGLAWDLCRNNTGVCEINAHRNPMNL